MKVEASIPPGFLLGGDISFETLGPHRIAVDEFGHPTYFVGWLDKDELQQRRVYPVDAARTREASRNIKRFLALNRGTIFLSSFLPENRPFRTVEDRFVKLPSGSNSEYGVFLYETGELDPELTRELFGATFDELEEFVCVFQSVAHYPAESHSERARITFSKSSENICDLTKAYIPRGFPYIAFKDSRFCGAHISLCGFYRLLALICECRVKNDNGLFNRLVEGGARPELIVQLRKAAFANDSDYMLDPNSPDVFC